MMKKIVFLFALFAVGKMVNAQKIDSIYFHLYTDSLKKGFYNYINVDGKTADGKWTPLTSDEVIFIVDNPDSLLKFQSNDLFIDSAYNKQTVTVKAVLKNNPKIWKEVTIYIRKRGFDEPLKSETEVLDEYKQKTKVKSKRS